MIPSSSPLQNTGVVERSTSKIIYKVTATYVFRTTSTQPIRFSFEPINSYTAMLVSNASVTTYASGGFATADVSYHIYGVDNTFAPNVKVFVADTLAVSKSETISYDGVECPYESSFYVTAYITILQSDVAYQTGNIITINAINTNNAIETLQLYQGFANAVMLNGSAVLNDGRVLKYSGNYYIYPAGTSILSATLTPVIANQTGAVDDYYVIRHRGNNKYTLLYGNSFGGIIGNDSGGGITGYKLDVYCGAITRAQMYAQATWGSAYHYIYLSEILSYVNGSFQ